jgi:hypothetical protein
VVPRVHRKAATEPTYGPVVLFSGYFPSRQFGPGVGVTGRCGVRRPDLALRTNPGAADPQVLATQHALLMADLDPAKTPAVVNYALQPDESLQAILAVGDSDHGSL